MRNLIDRAVLSRLLVLLPLVALGLALSPGPAEAHCDRLDGPVAEAAREALESGDFDTIRIWVGPDQEAELREAFDRSREVRTLGSEARHLADRHFLETAVRLHREAEGKAFTGLKPAGQPLPADLAAAERALETGEVGPLVELMTRKLEEQVTAWFETARQARAERDRSVAAGREWVDAYVRYITGVHGLYGTIQAPPGHGVGEDG